MCCYWESLKVTARHVLIILSFLFKQAKIKGNFTRTDLRSPNIQTFKRDKIAERNAFNLILSQISHLKPLKLIIFFFLFFLFFCFFNPANQARCVSFHFRPDWILVCFNFLKYIISLLFTLFYVFSTFSLEILFCG